MKNEIKVIDKVIEHFGNAYKAAEAMNVKHQQFYAWIGNGFIPFKRGAQIEQLTNGEIKAMEIWEDAGRRSSIKKAAI